MELTETAVRELVAQVLRGLDGKLAAGGAVPGGAEQPSGAGVFPDTDSAVRAARKAHAELAAAGLETRKRMVAALREAVLSNLDTLARMAVEETGMGRIADKVVKNRVAAEKTPGPEDLESASFSDDNGLTVVERAPYGVIGSITPSTNPTETVINNGIGMVSGGNSVVFNPHPSAKAVSRYVVSLLNEAMIKAGGPPNVLCTVAEPTIGSAQALFDHPGVNLLVVTGGPAVVKTAMKSAKKTIAAGPGNPPCVVDETADLAKAGRDIVAGAGFDNNIICIDEKEIIAVASIADQLLVELARNGAYILTREQAEKVTRLVVAEPGGPGREGAPHKAYVGKDASVIGRAAGIDVPSSARILLFEAERLHPLVWTEQLMPVIPLVRVGSVTEAIDLAVECEHGFRHTAVMHSRNVDALSRMARAMNCSLFVKNGSAFNGLGCGGAGFSSWTIASPTGEGLTRARTFTRERRCALIGAFRIV
jgi:acyl-CoA reductase-like NAD-dependent aldehyde dehydrogenase